MSFINKIQSIVLPKAPPNRLEILDWLRALAIIVVVLGHSNRPMAPGGAVGVSIFFALSGYLIATVLMRNAYSSRNLIVFLARRITRIYPLYFLSVIFLLIFFYFTAIESFEKVQPNLLRILAISGQQDEWVGYGFGVLWTLVIEFWFYLTFPFLLIFGLISRHLIAVLFAAIIVSIASKFFIFGNSLLLYYDHFLVGALVFAAAQANRIPKWLEARWVLYAGVVLLAGSIIFPYKGARDLTWYALSLSAASGTALVILYSHMTPVKASAPVLSFIGRISYSIYLVHAILLDVFPRFPSNIPIYFTAVLLVSTATYYFIEQPVIRLAHRWFKFSNPPTPPKSSSLA